MAVVHAGLHHPAEHQQRDGKLASFPAPLRLQFLWQFLQYAVSDQKLEAEY